jgi:hypothetical protein
MCDVGTAHALGAGIAFTRLSQRIQIGAAGSGAALPNALGYGNYYRMQIWNFGHMGL